MADFTDKLRTAGHGEKAPTAASLTFLSDLSSENRATFREMWPEIETKRRRRIVEQLATLAEDNINLDFRHAFLTMLGDKDARVRHTAIEGLYEDESRLLLGKLLDIVRSDPDADVREAAASSLGRFTYMSECNKLNGDSQKLRADLIHVASDPNENMDVRRRAVESLGYLHDDADVQALIDSTYKRGGRQAESALFAMGRSMDERWNDTVLGDLENDIPAMRYEAARASGEMELEAAVPKLVELVDDDDTEVKLAAIWSLGQIGGKQAATALARALKSNNEAVKEAAAEALQELAFAADPLNVI